MIRRRGFTLVELMVVVAILGVLGAMLVPQVSGMVERAKAAKIVTLIDTLRTACSAYFTDTGVYAYEYTGAGYSAATYHRLSMNPGVSGWQGPYLHKPLSTSDNPYMGTIYMYSATNNWASVDGFDLNGDAAPDTLAGAVGNLVVLYNIPLAVAQKVNDMVDGDTTANANWRTQGQIEYLNNYYLTGYVTGGR